MVRGRKRKPGKRLPCGKRPREDNRKEAMATVMAARQRHYGVTAAQAKDERLGTALGRLAFADQITPDQYAAGEIYGEIMARNHAVMGLPMDQPRSVTALLINEGIFGGGAPDPDPDLVAKVRKQAAAAILMLRTADSDAPGTAGRKPSVLVHAVVRHDAEASQWSPADRRNLCHGLDALCRLFRVRRDSS
jgi:hypothetical protein